MSTLSAIFNIPRFHLRLLPLLDEKHLRQFEERIAIDMELRGALMPAYMRVTEDVDPWSCECFLITVKDQPCGYIKVHHNRARHSASLDICILPEYQNGKIGVASLVLVARYLFEYAGLNRIESAVLAYNTRSLKVNARLMKFEGISRGSVYWKGKYHDLHEFGLLRSDFEVMKNDDPLYQWIFREVVAKEEVGREKIPSTGKNTAMGVSPQGIATNTKETASSAASSEPQSVRPTPHLQIILSRKATSPSELRFR